VLADSLYGESDNFIEALNHHQLSFVVAISNHSVLMPGAKVTRTQTKSSNEFFEWRHGNYLREIILARDEPLDIGK